MANIYEYVWKHTGKPPLDTNVQTLHFNKPLKQGSIFADLRNGNTYDVVAVSEVKDVFKHTPKERIRTLDGKTIPEEQLTALRDKHKFDANPDGPYLILPNDVAPNDSM